MQYYTYVYVPHVATTSWHTHNDPALTLTLVIGALWCLVMVWQGRRW